MSAELAGAKLVEAELRSLAGRHEALAAQRDALLAAVEDQQETFARVSERLAQAKSEMRAKEAELGGIQSKLAAIQEKELALFQGEGAEPPAPGEGGDLSPRDAVQVLRDMLDAIGERLGVPPLQNQLGKTGDDAIALDSILKVSIEYNGDTCGFRVTPTYTFSDLARDACRYWRLDPEEATLRDNTNTLWPLNGNVREVLREELLNQELQGSSLAMPKLKLVGTALEHLDAGRVVGGAGGDLGPPSSREREERERDYLAKLLLQEGTQERRASRKSKLKTRKRRSRLAIASSLSRFFHDAHERPYSHDDPPNFRSADAFDSSNAALQQGSQDYALRVQSRVTSACANLCVWLVFIATFCVALELRFSATTIFSSTVGFQGYLTGPFRASAPLSFADETFRHVYTSSGLAGTSDRQEHYPLVQVGDLYNFLREVVAPTLFGNVEGGLGTATQSLVGPQQRLVGPLLLLQNRVRSDWCALNPAFTSGLRNASQCWPPFALRMQHTSPFGDPPVGDSACAVLAQRGFQFDGSGAFGGGYELGHFSAYNPEGYFVVIPAGTELETALCAIDALQQGGWIDQGTRAVTSSFVVYNANLNLLIGSQVRLEQSSAGAAHSTIQYDRVSLSLYGGSMGSTSSGKDDMLIAADAIAGLYALYTLYKLTLDVILFGALRTLSTLWNLLSFMLVLSVFVGIALKVSYGFLIGQQLDGAGDPPELTFSGLRPAFLVYEAALWLDVATASIGVLLVFKFTQTNRKISAVFESLHRGAQVAAALVFVLLALLLVTGFSMYLVYGTKLTGWRTIQSTGREVLQLAMGNFAYARFRTAELLFTPFLFLFFLLFYFFVTLAVITAIFTDAYFEVSAAGLPRASPTRFWARLLLSPFQICFSRRQQAQQKQQQVSKKKD